MKVSVNVDLLGSSGSAKRITLSFSQSSQVSLHDENGEVLLSCPRERILRWKVADRRKLSSGLERCLDLQIQTEQGPQILRIRCLSDKDFDNVQDCLKKDREQEISNQNKADAVVEEDVNKSESKQKKELDRQRSSNITILKSLGSADNSEAMFRSLGTMLRSPTSRRKASSENNIISEEKEKSEDGQGSIDEHAKEAVPEKDKDLRSELTEALESLGKENFEKGVNLNRQLETLQGKIEILVIENERLEVSNHELHEMLLEKESESKDQKKILETINEANEDIFTKFETLTRDLQSAKDTLNTKEEECEAATANLTKLKAEKEEWILDKKSKKQHIEELTAFRKTEQESLVSLENTLASLQRENDDTRAKYEQLLTSNEENEKAKEEALALSKDAQRQVDHLANILARKESALRDLQKGQDEHLQQLHEATEKAESAQHECEIAQKRDQEKSKQLEILTQTLTEQRQEITNTLQSQWKAQVDESRNHCAKLDEQISALKSETLKGDLKLQQVLHEKELLERRTEQLTSTMTSSQICCSLTGISVNSVTELQKVQQLELERQSSVDDLQRVKRSHEAFRKESETTNLRLQAEIEELREQLRDGFKAKTELAEEELRLQNEIRALETQLKSEKANTSAMENRLLQQYKTMEDKFSKKLERLNEKGGRAFEELQNQLEEAETLISEKAKIQSKWKEETKKVAHELALLADEQQRERAIHEQERASANSELIKATATATELGKTLLLFKQQHSVLKEQLKAALEDNSSLEDCFNRLQEKYIRLQEGFDASKHEIKQLGEVNSRLERERDSYGLRYETIRRKHSTSRCDS